jgi:carbohydrate diacid regulator
MDTEGNEISCSGSSMSSCAEQAFEFARSMADSQEIQGRQYFKIYDDTQVEYLLLVGGGGETFYTIGKLAAFQIQNLLIAYKERFDKDNFIKNLLLDNLLLIDIYNRSKKLNIQAEAKRVVMLVETANRRDSNTLETVREFYENPSRDFVTAVDESNVIVIKDLSDGDQARDLDKNAQALEKFLTDANFTDIRIAYGTVVNEIKEVSRSFKEAKMAMDVGKIFYDDITVIAYSKLGIGRLIYQLPIPLCKIFIREIFEGHNPEDFDEETLVTIAKFFENSLNVSETARQLFIHRNTLVYRLDKLEKATGLDLRVFEGAITFRIALMVVKYIRFMEKFEY